MICSSEYVVRLSDNELFSELKKRGFNIGPISPTTRHIYEKKLQRILSETKTSPKNSPPYVNSSPESFTEQNIKNYTDQELFKALKDRNCDAGPILPTTRTCYEKKLLSIIKQSKLPGYPNLDRSISLSPNKSEKPSSFPNDVSVFSKPKIVEKHVPSLFPSLEFKLIDKETTNIVDKNRDEDSFMKINNFENSNRLIDPYSKLSHPNEKNNGSYLDYIQSRYQIPKQNLLKHNRRLNLDEYSFNKKPNNYQQNTKKLHSFNSYNSLYNQPPPPQPNNSSIRSNHFFTEQKIRIREFFLENFKQIFIFISILIILTMLFSSKFSNYNPMDL